MSSFWSLNLKLHHFVIWREKSCVNRLQTTVMGTYLRIMPIKIMSNHNNFKKFLKLFKMFILINKYFINFSFSFYSFKCRCWQGSHAKFSFGRRDSSKSGGRVNLYFLWSKHLHSDWGGTGSLVVRQSIGTLYGSIGPSGFWSIMLW